MERSRRLDDDALAEEIELYGDLVVAASEAGDVLSQAEIDRLLGVEVAAAPAAPASAPVDEDDGAASDQVITGTQDGSGRASVEQPRGA